jgi:L-lactate dehydrogenase complex protein LldE
VHELSQFLTGVLGVDDVGARYPARVAYHPTCHSLRALRLGDGPGRLLAAVEGLDLVEIDEADQCCGFGGTFAVNNAEVSMAMLEDKLSAIERSGAEAVTAVDNSCLMQIGGGLSRRGSPVRAVHLAEILAAS